MGINPNAIEEVAAEIVEALNSGTINIEQVSNVYNTYEDLDSDDEVRKMVLGVDFGPGAFEDLEGDVVGDDPVPSSPSFQERRFYYPSNPIIPPLQKNKNYKQQH